MHCRDEDSGSLSNGRPEETHSSRRHFLSQLAALSASLTIACREHEPHRRTNVRNQRLRIRNDRNPSLISSSR